MTLLLVGSLRHTHWRAHKYEVSLPPGILTENHSSRYYDTSCRSSVYVVVVLSLFSSSMIFTATTLSLSLCY